MTQLKEMNWKLELDSMTDNITKYYKINYRCFNCTGTMPIYILRGVLVEDCRIKCSNCDCILTSKHLGN